MLEEEGGFNDEIRSIDSWQGREKEMIIFSATRCNPQRHIGFIDNDRRMNVSLTRAKHGLIIVGSAATLSEHPKYAEAILMFRESKTFAEGLDEAKAMLEKMTQK